MSFCGVREKGCEVNVLAVLDGAGVGRRPVCFVAHSMGGLLVKQLLRHASTLAKEYRHICDFTRGIIFFSTPHTGSSVASLVSYLQFLLRTTVAVRELEAHEPRLRELNLWYRNNAADLNIATRVFYETRETKGVMVVNATSADPGLPAVTPIPVDSNHFDICCPELRNDLRYVQTLKFLNDRLPVTTDAVPHQSPDRLSPLRQRLLIAQSPREMRRLLYETEQVLAELPHDPNAKQLHEEIRMALRYEEVRAAPAERDSYRMSRKSRKSPTMSLIPLVGIPVLLYWAYRLIAWFAGW